MNTNLSVLTNLSRTLPAVPGIDPRAPGTLEAILAYCKPMSEPDVGELVYYDEMEWRLVPLPSVGQGSVEWHGAFKEGGEGRVLHFEPEDVRLVVFPDEPTRRLALQDQRLRPSFERHLPMLIDATELGQF